MLKALKSLVSAAAVYGLGTVLSKFIGFFLLPIFTRALTPAEYGLFETFNVILLLFTAIGTLGMDTAMMRFYFDSAEPSYRKRVASTAYMFALAAGLLVTSVGMACSPALNSTLFGGTDHIRILHITFLAVAASVVNTIQLALLQTKRQPGRYSFLTFLRFVVMYGLSVWFLLRGDSVYGVMLAQLIGYVMAIVVGFVFNRRDVAFVGSGELARKMLLFGAPLVVGSVNMWLLSSSDRFFLLRLSTLENLGLYSLGSRFASIVQFAVLAFQLAWPQFAFSTAQQLGVAHVQSRILTYYLFVAIPLVLAVTLFTPEMLALLATARYAGAASVVFLLSYSFLMHGCYSVFGIILSHTKQTLSILTITIPPLVVSIVLNTLLVPALGGTGSAIASACAYTLMAVLAYAFTNRLIAVRYEWKRIVVMVLGALVIVGLNAVLHVQSYWIGAFIKVIFLLIYVGLLALMGFFQEI
jgi:O-antigen/teichoic acid export membrane protein